MCFKKDKISHALVQFSAENNKQPFNFAVCNSVLWKQALLWGGGGGGGGGGGVLPDKVCPLQSKWAQNNELCNQKHKAPK